MTLAEAAEADRAERIVEAASLYEAYLASPSAATTPDAFVDLAVLYWQVTDYGFWTGHGLPPDFVGHAGERFRQVLDEARRLHLDSPAVHFWTRYIAWADLGEPLDPDECRSLLRSHPEYLEPVMFLFATSQGTELDTEARELLRRCRETGTCRCRYIASVIESVLARARRGKG